jgi:uncharacterized repeat protein (TIGR02059 family)
MRFNLRQAVATIILVALLLLPILSVFGGSVDAATQGGVLDTTWPTTAHDRSVEAIVVAPDGKIWVADNGGTRAYTSAGAVTVSSIWEGVIPYALAVQTIGTTSYILAGANGQIYRYSSSGVKDTTFGSGQTGTHNVLHVYGTSTAQKIFTGAGSDFKRFTANGVLESTVAMGGSVNAIATQTVGGVDYILVGGAFGLKRYTTASVLDNSFVSNTTATVNAMKVQSDGKILTAGTFGLRRYNQDGSLDSSFPTISTSILSLAIQGDGKIIAGTSTALLRYSSAGVVETQFNTNAALNGTFSTSELAIESTGNIIAGGSSNVTTKRYLRRYSWENVAPGAPLAPTAVAGDGSASITVAAGTGVTPTGYTVYVSGDVSKNCTVTGSSGSCTISGLVNGTAYTFYAVARNIDATSIDSPASNLITPADTIAPLISSAAVDILGTTLTLTYNEALNSTTAGTVAFTVSAGGTNFAVSSVTVSGSTVQLGLASVIGQGLTVTVSYAAPASNSATANLAIQDSVGNDAVSLTSRAVTNGSTIDTTAPVYSSSSVNSAGTVLTLTYGEALSATTAPASAFSVVVNGVSVTVNSVTVSGSTVQLSLGTIVGTGQSVTVAYVAPAEDTSNANSAIQDAVGNDSVSFAARAITTNSSTVDLTAPVFSSAAVNTAGTILTLTYNEALNATTAPASAFSVTVAGVSRAVNSVVVSGSTVQLTLASTVGSGQAVTFAYTAPAADGSTSNSAVQDNAGNDAISLTSRSATNSSTVDQTAPTFSSAAVNTAGTILTLTYNEALSATTSPANGFVVTVAGVTRTVSSVAVSGSTVQLTLASAVERGTVVTVAYTSPTPNTSNTNNAIQDTTGNDAISLSATSVTNNSTLDTTAPVLSSAVLAANGTTLTLTYNETLSATTAATTDFSVLVDGVAATVSSRAISGSTVQLTLSSAVLGTSIVTVAYAAPTSSNLTTNSAVQDAAGNDAASFTATSVTNNSTEGPPRLVLAEVLANGTQMKLTWSETLGSTYPLNTAFTISVNGSPVTVTGTNTVTPSNYFTFNLSQTITSNQSVTVSYIAPASNTATTNNAVQDTAGNDALAFTNTAVTNSSTIVGDTTAPTLVSASLNTTGTVLSLSYNETLNSTIAPGSSFTVLVNGVEFSVSSVAVSSSVVQLTLGSAVEAGQTVSVSYVAPTPNNWPTNFAIQDMAGNDAISLSSQSVINNSTAGPDIAPPTLSSVTAVDTSVTLQFNETLKPTPTPALSAFTVFVGETPVTPTAISISGATVNLTLPTSVISGTEVRVSYVAPASSSGSTNAAIQDSVGNDAISFSGSTRPTSTVWGWVETFDSATMTTTSSQCPGGGSINRSKRTTLPNGVTYTVAVTGPYLCIHDATESLSERGGAAGMFVATGLVTEPGLKLTTSNDGCSANVICNGRGRLFLTFSQPVVDPVFSFAGWGGSASGVSWSEMQVITPGITMSKLSGTNISVSADGRYVEDNGQTISTRCNSSTAGSSAVCGSLQLNGTVTTVEFEVFQQTLGGTGNEDTWNLTASMAEDFGLVPTTYETSGVASHGVGTLRLGATVEADQASTLYATTNADSVARWTSLANNAKKDDGVADWINSPTINFGTAGSTYTTAVSLAGVASTANLCGWIDFNRDEYFAYSERACATDPSAGATSATLTWTVPADVGAGITYARVRLSYDTITDAVGKLGTGEVEDYSLVLPATSLPAAVNDASTNGQDVNQLFSPLTNDQFETNYPANNSTLKLCGSGQTPNTCSVTTLVIDGQGTYTVNADGTITFNPLPTFTGTATPVTYQISDTQVSPRTTSATITPTVIPRPTARADTSTDLLNITQTMNPLSNDTAGSSDAPFIATTVRLCGSGEASPLCTATSVSVTGGTYAVSQTTGIITFTPTTNFTGTATPVSYQVSDSLNQVATSTYTPSVVGTPTAANDTSSGAWNVNQIISPFANDTIASGHHLGSLALCGTSPVETPNLCSQPTLTTADGTYTVNANGTVTFDPLPTFTGFVTQPIRYQAVDDLSQYVDATITPYVTPPSPPTAVADTTSNLVNVTQTKDVLANDTTIDPLITLDATSVRLCGNGQVNPNCTATSVAVTGGTFTVNTTTGVVSFTPSLNWSGTAPPVSYQVTDSTNQKVSSTYTPTVITALNDVSSGAWNVNQTISPFSNDVAVSGHPFGSLKLCDTTETPNNCTLTSLTVTGQGTYTVNANGTVTFDPLPTFTGTATAITYQALDDLGQFVSATITPSVTPPPGPVAVTDTSSGFLNTVQTKNVLANDSTSDPVITLNATSVRLCGSGEVNPDCTATSVVVTGGTYSVNTTTGVVSFTPDSNWSGTATAVTYQVTDSTSQTTTATYTPTVYPKPTASNDISSGAYDTNQVISPLALDGFSESAPAVLSTLKLCGANELPNACTETSLSVSGVGTYTVNPDGTVTFNPLPTFKGTAPAITYQAADTLGQFVSATITPTVTAPPAPVATADTESVLRGGTATFTTITGTLGLATGTELQTTGDNKTCLYVPSSTTCDTDNVISITGQGTYTLNPATGVVTFVAVNNAIAGSQTTVTYRVTDITGQTATSTLTPVVPPAPTALVDTSEGNHDTNQTLNILANDSAGDASAPLDASTVKLCGSNQTPNGCTETTLVVAGQGIFTVNADGTVTFDPLPTFSGTATAVTYQVADSLGQVTSATITPTVYAPPNAVNDTSSGNYDTNQVINPLINDVDGSGTIDPTSVKLCAANVVAPSCTSTSLTTAGEGTYTVNQTTGVVTFDPLPSFTGTASPITYQVADSLGQTDSATITPTVGAPPLPVAVNDTSVGAYDTNQLISPIFNDTRGATDFPFVASTLKLCGVSPLQTPNNCTLTSLTISGEGTYTVNADGTVTFDPLPTFKGNASPITYQIADSLGRIDDATITPEVTPPPAPVATAQTQSVLPGGTATYTTITGTSGLATGTGLQTSGVNATCLIVPLSSPATCDSDNSVTITGEGTFTLNPTTGVVTYVASSTITGGTKTAITYRVTDITGQTATSTLTPVVPPAPVPVNDTSIGNYDTNQTISPLANDTPGDASAPLVASTVKLCGSGQTPNNCTVTTLVVDGQGTYTVNANGTVTFDPLPTYTGTATAIRYQAADSLGQIENATITVTVRTPPNAVNDESSGNYDTNQVISPLLNDVDGSGTIDATTVKLCASGQVAPTCTSTSLTTAGEGTYTVNQTTGVVTFDPLPSFTGTATPIAYQISDSFGQTDSATITPTVGAPPLPVAVNDTSTGNWDTNQAITPTSNDTPGSTSFPFVATSVKLCGSNQSAPTCTATSLTVANEGTYTVNANGTVTFDPVPSFTGTATAITYQAADTLGRIDDATITPTVTPPPAPFATPETMAVIPGGTATFTTITGTSGLATGTQLQTSGAKATCLIVPLSIPATCDADNSVTIAGEGTFTLNPTTGVVTFVADVNATPGTKTALTYRVTDVTGQTATSTLTPVIPQPPVANPDTNTDNWDTNQTLSPLTNDTAGAASAPLVAATVKLCGISPVQNPDNCTLTTLIVPNEGTYIVNANGTVTFDPLPTFNGIATPVKYQVADSLGQIADSTITPTVRAPRAPTATPDTNTGSWDTNQTISPLANDTPGESTAPLDASTVKLCGVAPNAQSPNNCTQTTLTISSQGTYTVNANGTVTFDPLPSFTGTATAVKYQVTDVIGQTVNTTITPIVLSPPAPVASPGTVSLIAGGTEDFDPIFGTDALAAKSTGGPELTNSTVCIVDPATSICGNTAVTITGEGTFTLNTTTGVVTYTALDTATSGTKTAISYKITDALNVTVTNTLTPSIIPKPTARPDTSIGVMEQTQTLSPVGNDSPGAITYPLNPKTVLLCGATETAPTCTKTTVTVSGEGTYVVQLNGTVQFTPESTYYGTATSLSYVVKDSLGQVATSTLTPKVVPPPAPITELDTGTAEQGSSVLLSPWANDNGGVVPNGVSGTVALVPASIRLCGPTDAAPNCTRTTLTTDDGTYTVDTATGKVTFVHRTGFLGTVTQPVTYQIANDWTGLSGIGISTNILIPTIIPPAPPAPPAPSAEPPADPNAVDDVSKDGWDINQTIAVFTNDTFPSSHALHVTLRLCMNSVTKQDTGQVAHDCSEMSLTVAGEGTYTVNQDGTVTFDPLPTFFGTATPIRYQATDALGRYVNATITPTVDAPPIVLITRNELPATGNNVITQLLLMLLLSIAGIGLRQRFKNA